MSTKSQFDQWNSFSAQHTHSDPDPSLGILDQNVTVTSNFSQGRLDWAGPSTQRPRLFEQNWY